VTRIRTSTVIDAPPRRVWEAVRDIATHTTWMRDAVAIRFLSERTEGVGTTFDCDTKVGPLRLTDRMEVTEWRPGRVIGITHQGVVTGRGRFTLRRARGGRTRFTWDERLRFPWWVGGPLAAAAARPVLRHVWRTNLRQLKQRVEGDA
jgi:uncharacterized protein YndB with AHSA1/START domain